LSFKFDGFAAHACLTKLPRQRKHFLKDYYVWLLLSETFSKNSAVFQLFKVALAAYMPATSQADFIDRIYFSSES